MKIRTALIASAGFGTRFLPITKTIQKEMLPILARPVIDYVVADLVKAGVERIVFVVSEHNRQLLHYYSENPRLRTYLDQMNKASMYEQVRDIHRQAEFTFIKQADSDQYGTATPLKLAEKELAREGAFFVFMGDDMMYAGKDHSVASQMLEQYEKSQAAGLITCIQKPAELLSKYGVAKVRRQNEFEYLDEIIEKPQAGSAPSNLVNVSKYILSPQVFPILDKQQPNSNSGELYITDTINLFAQNNQVVVFNPPAQYLDAGYLGGWLKANLTMAWEDPELKREIESTIAELKAG